jgi:hypothetical protein
MRRTLTVILFVLFTSVICFGQSSFNGLTPGKSTRAEVERVLGQPVKKVSATLSEYAPRQLKLTNAGVTLNSGKIYVQYRDGLPAAIAERIELLLCARDERSIEIRNSECKVLSMHDEYDRGPDSALSGGALDAYQSVGDKIIWYFGPPRYMTRTDIHKASATGSSSEVRWGFYSKELYEATAPTENCTGVLRGEWETNRGRTTFTRGNEYGRLRGSYADNNGTFTGEIQGDNLKGEWKDSTGSGTMFLQLYFPGAKQFTGSWERTSGTGPAKGTWEGRCVETKSNGNN